MTYSILSASGAIAAHGPARELWPNVSFPSAGPDRRFLADHNAVVIRNDPPHDPATHYLRRVEPYLLDGEVFGREPVERPPVPVQPQWQRFQMALLTDGTVHDMMMIAKDAYPGLISAWSTGLGQAALGQGFETFLTAWNLARNLPNPAAEGTLLAQSLVDHIATLAAATDLPADFIAGLNPQQP